MKKKRMLKEMKLTALKKFTFDRLIILKMSKDSSFRLKFKRILKIWQLFWICVLQLEMNTSHLKVVFICFRMVTTVHRSILILKNNIVLRYTTNYCIYYKVSKRRKRSVWTWRHCCFLQIHSTKSFLNVKILE